MEIIFDIDGFFSPANMSGTHKLISVDMLQQPFDTLLEQYYLGVRSAMFICEDTIKDENEALEAIRRWREASLGEAWKYVRCHAESGHVLAPDFIWISKNEIIEILKNKYPEVEDIELRISMKPRLSARVVDTNIITFPSLARTMVNHYNLVLINSVFRDINKDGQIWEEPDRRNIARYFFPYLLFCHDDFSVAHLPFIGADSSDAVTMVIRFTSIQLLFILAHEYAHILLQHPKNIYLSSDIRMRLENEADLFALDVVFEYVEKNNSCSKQNAFTAIRWLFKYQLLEESVGILFRGGTVDFLGSKFEERRGVFQMELFRNYGIGGSNLLEIRGFYALVELQAILYDLGPEFINRVVNVLNASKRTGVVEPWWNEITNK